MSLLTDAERITEYRIPTKDAEITEEDDTYILRVKDPTILDQEHETKDLPNTVECPECETETAEQIGDDQLFKCTECGRETVRTQ